MNNTPEETLVEIVENIASNSSYVGLIDWIQDEFQSMSMKLNTFASDFPLDDFWLCKQNPVLLGITVACASSLIILLEYYRKRKSIPKYEILLATVVSPSSTPEDVAVNCTFGALSVGMKTNLNNPEVLELWKQSGSEKRVVAVDDECILAEMQRLAEENNIVNVLVKDAPTCAHSSTTLAIGPAPPLDLAVFAGFGRVIGQSKIAS